jgi:hypothetical protein
MWFRIRAIKEVYNHKYSIDCIVDMLDESSLLRFLESYKILAVSHSLYTQSPE